MEDKTRVESGNPLVSVAMCTFNGANYIREQLQSVLNQTHNNLEVVIVDDGSTDGTVEIIEGFALEDKRVKVFVNPERLNLNKNFEKAMALCHGEYICPCDQDDVWADSKLKVLLQNIGSYNLIFSNSHYVDSEGNSLGRNLCDDYVNQRFNNPLVFVFFNAIPGHTMMLRKQVVSAAMPFPKSIFYDHWLAFVSLTDGEINYIPQTLQFYRQHNSNMVGAKGVKKRKKKMKSQTEMQAEAIVNLELKLLYLSPDTSEHATVCALLSTYRSSNFFCKLRRVLIFMKNRETLLLLKRQASIKKTKYCLKMFSRVLGSSPFNLVSRI